MSEHKWMIIIIIVYKHHKANEHKRYERKYISDMRCTVNSLHAQKPFDKENTCVFCKRTNLLIRKIVVTQNYAQPHDLCIHDLSMLIFSLQVSYMFLKLEKNARMISVLFISHSISLFAKRKKSAKICLLNSQMRFCLPVSSRSRFGDGTIILQ